jgi:hypothetical protein
VVSKDFLKHEIEEQFTAIVENGQAQEVGAAQRGDSTGPAS